MSCGPVLTLPGEIFWVYPRPSIPSSHFFWSPFMLLFSPHPLPHGTLSHHLNSNSHSSLFESGFILFPKMRRCSPQSAPQRLFLTHSVLGKGGLGGIRPYSGGRTKKPQPPCWPLWGVGVRNLPSHVPYTPLSVPWRRLECYFTYGGQIFMAPTLTRRLLAIGSEGKIHHTAVLFPGHKRWRNICCAIWTNFFPTIISRHASR